MAMAAASVSTTNVPVIIERTGGTTWKKRTRYQRSRIAPSSRLAIEECSWSSNPSRESLAVAAADLARDAQIGLERVIADVESLAGAALVAPALLEDEPRVVAGPGAHAFVAGDGRSQHLRELAPDSGGRSSSSIRSDSISARARSTSRSNSRTFPGHG